MTSTLIYSSTSGEASVDTRPATPLPEYWTEYCFVCSRATDHRGEHDGLVDAGLAAYEFTTTPFEDVIMISAYVVKLAAWDDTVAREVCDAEYERLYGVSPR